MIKALMVITMVSGATYEVKVAKITKWLEDNTSYYGH